MRAADPLISAPELLSWLPEPLPAGRILLIRLGAIGDVVRTRFAFPGIRALYPGACIDWLVEDRAAAALEGIVGLDNVVTVPRSALRMRRPFAASRRLRELLGELRERRYDLAVDFHGIFKSGLLAWAARIPLRVGYDHGLSREGSHAFLTHRAGVRETHLSRFYRNAALVRYLGGKTPETPPPVQLPPGSDQGLEQLPQAFLAIHAGTSPSTLYKRWLPERYAEVARRLQQRLGLPSVVTWGPVAGELECAQEVVSRASGAAQIAPRTSGLGQLLALYRRASLFIGSDSGPMHLAALVGAPIVAIFGPTDPVENAPFPGVQARVLRRDLGCNPCRRGCSSRPCMAAVRVEDVLRAALELVAHGNPVE